ncbi:response regulator [Desulfohalovibrio reitneri]|uniref:response regulator n=1 Tax=Desulfohalovibrio reitneri TaxID=1307759 RepID=UPI0004A72A03|nr:response regulator [Desulfohalovibrio reitneri]
MDDVLQLINNGEIIKPVLLLVDDQPATRKLVKTSLKDAMSGFFKTIDVTSVKGAIRSIEEQETSGYGISFIILDYTLDDGHCLPILEHIRERGYSHIKVMLLTGNDDTTVLKRLLGYPNVVSAVIKPFTIDKLRREFILHACASGDENCTLVCRNCNI